MKKVPVWEKNNFFHNDKNAIKELIKRKNKLSKYEGRRDFSIRVFSIGGGLSLFSLIALISYRATNSNIWAIFEITLQNSYFILLLFILGFFYSTWLASKKKAKEEKEKYHTLRKEISDNTREQWLKIYGQQTMEILIKELKQEYDIEVSYKG